MLRFNFSTIEVGTLAEIERNFFAHVRCSMEEFAARYAALADWSPVLSAENPAQMIDRVRGVVQKNGLPRTQTANTRQQDDKSRLKHLR